jgi:hypothetical protein
MLSWGLRSMGGTNATNATHGTKETNGTHEMGAGKADEGREWTGNAL